MSRKLPGARDPPAILTQQVPEEEDLLPGPDSGPGPGPGPRPRPGTSRANLFANLIEDDSEEEEERKTSKSDDEKSESDGATETGAKPKVTKSSKRKKKRGKENRIPDDSDGQDIDKIIEEIDEQYGNLEIAAPSSSEKKITNNFTVTRQNLNYVHELTKVFGRDTLDEAGEFMLKRARFGSILCHYKEDWPGREHNKGLAMIFLKKENDKSYFCYTHSSKFHATMSVALNYMSYESLHEGFFTEFSHCLPYIIQIMEYNYNSPEPEEKFLKMLNERALLILENHFHDQFNITAGTCYLEFKYQTNRILYSLLFKKMLRCSRFLCFRSALEYAKLIRSLDPKDNLAMVLVFDYYAIRCHEYQWFVDTMADSIQHPNVAFSYPLALYHLTNKEDTTKCSELLLSAICHFPELAYSIMNKLPSRYKNEEVKQFFCKFYDKLPLCILKTTCVIYSTYSHILWDNVDKWFCKILEEAYEILKSPERLQEKFNINVEMFPQSILRQTNKITLSMARFCTLHDDFNEHVFQYPIAKEEMYISHFWWDPYPVLPVQYSRTKTTGP